jgi:putative tryptophan/tyrosine transport system substrate-binding protein
MQSGQLRRREFITLISGAAASCLWPRAAGAQQAKPPTIGFLGGNTASTQRQWTDAFVQRLRELGWIEGHSVVIEYRFAEGLTERYAQDAAEFVRNKVDVIVTAGAGAFAVKQATSLIPIVFTQVPDPVGSGLVTSLARPGGNLTGLSSMTSDLVGKRIELLRQIVPALQRLAVIANVGNPNALLEMREVEKAGRTLGLDVATCEIRGAADIAPAFDALKGRADALYVVTDPLAASNRLRINTLALGARLATIYNGREIVVETGGLMSYGPSIPELYRRAGDLVDKILRGTKPADIPVEQPTKFELVINLTTAKALGLTVPTALLALADEVIE